MLSKLVLYSKLAEKATKKRLAIEIITFFIIVILTSFIHKNIYSFIFSRFNEYSGSIINFLFFVLLLSTIAFIKFLIEKFFNSDELYFLKSVGYDTNEILLVFINNHRIYIGLQFMVLEAINLLLQPLNMIISFAYSLIAILIIYFNVLNYEIIKIKTYRMVTRIIRLVLLVLTGSFVLNTASSFQSMELNFNSLVMVAAHIGENDLVIILKRFCILFGPLPVLVLIITFCTWLLLVRNLCLDVVPKTIRLSKTKTIFTMHNKIFFNNRILDMALKDCNYLYKCHSFICMNSLFTFFALLIAFKNYSIDTDIVMFFAFINLFFNLLYTQKLFKIDAQLTSLYVALPIFYKEFFIGKIVSVVCFSILNPILLSVTISVILDIALFELLKIICLVIIVSIIIAVYYVSIMLFFYPKIDKTDIPMFICILFMIFLPPIIPFIIVAGIKRGRINWNRIGE